MSFNLALPRIYRKQVGIQEDKVPPIQNVWYTIADLTGGVKIDFISYEQNNDESADKALELKLTVDGVEMTDSAPNSANGATQYVFLTPTDSIDHQTSNIGQIGFPTSDGAVTLHVGSLECFACKIEARMTSAAGTNQDLKVRVNYSKVL